MCSRRGAFFVLTRGELARPCGENKNTKARGACTSFLLASFLRDHRGAQRRGNPSLCQPSTVNRQPSTVIRQPSTMCTLPNNERFYSCPIADGAIAGFSYYIFLYWYGHAILYGRFALL